MKHCILLLITAMVFGCSNTGLIKVDDCNPRLPIISFEDNPAYTVIEFDSSSITNFNAKKLYPVLEMSSFHQYPVTDPPSAEVMAELKKLDPVWHYNTGKFRIDPYRVEGKRIKILSIDSVGTYRLVYVE